MPVNAVGYKRDAVRLAVPPTHRLSGTQSVQCLRGGADHCVLGTQCRLSGDELFPARDRQLSSSVASVRMSFRTTNSNHRRRETCLEKLGRSDDHLSHRVGTSSDNVLSSQCRGSQRQLRRHHDATTMQWLFLASATSALLRSTQHHAGSSGIRLPARGTGDQPIGCRAAKRRSHRLGMDGSSKLGRPCLSKHHPNDSSGGYPGRLCQ